MQIVEVRVPHYNFYCPVTGRKICDEKSADQNVPSLMGTWVDLNMEEPMINNTKLREDWEKLSDTFYTDDTDTDVWEEQERFLKRYDAPNWIAFKITIYHKKSGIENGIVWHVIDMETQLVEEKTI